METKTVFPVFGELHADDSPALIPSQEPARKVYENPAKLFIAPKGQQAAQQEDTESEICELSGNTRLDTVRALVALAFLIDFLAVTGTDEIRKTAEVLMGDRHE